MAIGTTAAIIGTSAAGLAIQASSASKAAKAQVGAANNQLELQRATYEDQKELLAPYRTAGAPAQNALAFDLGVGDRPEGYGGFEKSRGYEFGLQEGQRAIDASAAARGGLFSGATGKALTKFGQDYATGQRNNYLSQLGAMAGSGQNAAAQTGQFGNSYAAGSSNALSAIGNAGAAGAIGIGNAVNNGIGNALTMMQYQKAGAF